MMVSKGTFDLHGAVRQLIEADEWLILVHEKPDGDALGSGSALYQAGLRMGKSVSWGGRDPFPEIYSFLEGSKNYKSFQQIPVFCAGANPLIICLDTSNIERSVPGLQKRQVSPPVLNVDHHVDNGLYGTMNLVDPSASATAELIWHLLEAMECKYGQAEALALYTGLVTDTGRFAFRATTSRTHCIAATLLDKGLDPQEADRKIFHNRSLQAFHLWGKAFSRAELIPGTSAVVSWLSTEDFCETNALPEETEGLVNELLTLREVEFAILLTESETQIRVSLRSDGRLSAGDMARSFGGGGHEQAAGFRFAGTLGQALKSVQDKIRAGYDEFLSVD